MTLRKLALATLLRSVARARLLRLSLQLPALTEESLYLFKRSIGHFVTACPPDDVNMFDSVLVQHLFPFFSSPCLISDVLVMTLSDF